MGADNPNEDGNENKFDAAKFKAEIMEDNRKIISESLEAFGEGIMSKINSTTQARKDVEEEDDDKPSKKSAFNISDVDFDDLGDELEALDIDKSQASAIISLVSKAISKTLPDSKKITQNVLTQVDDVMARKEWSVQAAKLYPGVLDKKSDLFKTAQKELQSMDAHEQASARATYNAIERAARKLGIDPVTIENLKSKEALEPKGKGPKDKKKNDSNEDEAVEAFSSSFGIDPETYRKHLKERREKAAS